MSSIGNATRAVSLASFRNHCRCLHIRGATTNTGSSRPLLAGFRRRLSSSAADSSSSTSSVPYNALRPSRTTKMALTILTGTGLLSLWCAHRSIQVIRTGEVGVQEFWWGELSPDLLSPGSHVVHPLSTVTKYSLQPRHRVYTWDILGQNGISFQMEVAIVYKLDPDKIQEMYVETGTTNEDHDWHLEAVAKSMLQTIVARTNTRDLRRTHQQIIANELKTKLKEFYQGICIDLVVLKNIALPEHCVEGQKELDRLYYVASAEHQKALVKGAKARSLANYHAVARSTMKRHDEKSMFSAGVNSQQQEGSKEQAKATTASLHPPATSTDKIEKTETQQVSKKRGGNQKVAPKATRIVKAEKNELGKVTHDDKKVERLPSAATARELKDASKEAMPEGNSAAAVSKTTEKQP